MMLKVECHIACGIYHWKNDIEYNIIQYMQLDSL